MKLKKIILQGFKSFCDKTVLVFDVPVTAIVGPNGCGKSNISDALRWVLGEQSAKSLRGDKMFDVIFSGSHNRKMANFAEVTLVFTEIGDSLPVDYEELAVSRKLYRNGDSLYAMNNQEVRLKDIHNLLMNSGLGKNSYSILEQGKMDEVIVASPIERRGTFEQAAGILRFKQSKKEALKKLEAMQGNILRLSDISKEVDKQMLVLEKQAQKAKEYKENKALFEKLEKSLLVQRCEEAKQAFEKSSFQLDSQESLLENLEEACRQLDVDLSQAVHRLEEEEGVYQEKNGTLFQQQKELELLALNMQNLSNQSEHLKKKKKQLEEEVKSFFRDAKTAEKEHHSNQKKHGQLEEKHSKLIQGFDALREKVKEEEEALTNKQKKVQEIRDELLAFQKSLTDVLSRKKENELRLENNREKLKQVQQRETSIEKRSADLEAFGKEKKQAVAVLSKEIDIRQATSEKLKEKVAVLEKELQSSTEKFKSLQSHLSESEAKRKVLIQMKDQAEGLSPSAKKLLKASQDNQHPLYGLVGLLSDKITTSKKYHKSCASLLKAYENTLYIQKQEAVATVHAYCEKEGYSDISFTVLQADMQSPELPLIESTQVLFEALNEVLWVQQLDLSLVGSKQKKGYLTPEGAYLDTWGVLHLASGTESSRFVRNAEIRDLEKVIETLHKEKTDLESSFESLEKEKQDKLQEQMLLDKEVRSKEMKLVEENFAYQRTLNDIKELQHQKVTLTAAFKDLDKEAKNLEEQKQAVDQESSGLEKKIKEGERASTSEERIFEKEKKAFEKSRLDFEQRQQKINESREELSAVKRLLEVFIAKKEEGEKHLQRLEQEKVESLSILEENQEKNAAFSEQKKQMQDKLKVFQQDLKQQQKVLTTCKDEIERVQKQIQKNQESFKNQENAKTKIAIDQAQFESTIQSMEKELLDRYQLEMSQMDPQEYSLSLSLQEADKKLLELRKKIELAGDINMTSIQEFEKLGDRKYYLEKQTGDLEESKEELLNIISQLDEESRQQFKEAMLRINESFQKNFQILFNGGEADLKYTEGEDILEAGIDIVAKPPGKHMRSISLLSGGEKCMTAIALLFAIFEYRPSPFCVLDEIDAPLDDTNVSRFVNILSEYIHQTQFIVITHNKRTMAMADVLLGVSMQERGVSKILMMNFQKAEKLVEMAKA